MKPANQPNRRPNHAAQAAMNRRQSAAAGILRKTTVAREDYTTFDWLLLIGTLVTIILISFLFTPYTHQLDEIKNVLLMALPPFLLLAAIYKTDFSQFTWRTHGATILLGLYTIFMVFSWSINSYKLVNERVIWFHAGCATFTVVFAWFLNTENKFRKIMIFFVVLGLASTILGLFLFAGRYTTGIYEGMRHSPYWNTPSRQPWMTLIYTLMSSHDNMYSFILNEDFYAAFLVMLTPLAAAMFFAEERIWYKVLALVSFIMMFVCLVLTRSTDSITAIMVAYPVFIILCFKYVRNWNFSRGLVITFILCVIGMAIVLGFLMAPKIAAVWDFKSGAFEGRRVLWGGGFWPWLYGKDETRSHLDWLAIIFGVGPGGYRHYFPWFRRPDYFDQQINNVTTFGHNWYLDVLLETGLVGLVLFMAFFVRVFGDAVRQIRTSPNRTHVLYQIGLIAGLIGISMQNFSSPNNRWAVAAMTYWSFFGLSMGLYNLDNPGVAGSSVAKVGNYFGYRIGKYVTYAYAAAFFIRCVFPTGQAFTYWGSATANAEGLHAMDTYDSPGISESDRNQALQIAKAEFEHAIDLNPTYTTSYYKLGHIYNQLDQRDKGIQTYETLDAINPSYSEVDLNLGILYANKAEQLPNEIQDMAKQADELQKQIQSGPADLRENLKNQYGQLVDEIKARENNLDKDRIANMEKAWFYIKEAAHQSIKPNVQFLAGTIGSALANIYEADGNDAKALKLRQDAKHYFDSIITYKPKLEEVQADQKQQYPLALNNLLQLADKMHNPADKITVLQRMVADNPDNDQYIFELMKAYDAAGKTGDKLKYLEQAVHNDPTDANLRRILASAYKDAGEQKKYVQELRRVEVLQPGSKPALAALYQEYKKAGNVALASKYAEKLTSAGVNVADLDATLKATSQSAAVTAPAKPTSAPVNAAAPNKATAGVGAVTSSTPQIATQTKTSDERQTAAQPVKVKP